MYTNGQVYAWKKTQVPLNTHTCTYVQKHRKQMGGSDTGECRRHWRLNPCAVSLKRWLQQVRKTIKYSSLCPLLTSPKYTSVSWSNFFPLHSSVIRWESWQPNAERARRISQDANGWRCSKRDMCPETLPSLHCILIYILTKVEWSGGQKGECGEASSIKGRGWEEKYIFFRQEHLLRAYNSPASAWWNRGTSGRGGHKGVCISFLGTLKSRFVTL